MEQLEHSYAAGVSVNWCKNSGDLFSINDKAENTHTLGVAFVSVCPTQLHAYLHMLICMLISSQFFCNCQN